MSVSRKEKVVGRRLWAENRSSVEKEKEREEGKKGGDCEQKGWLLGEILHVDPARVRTAEHPCNLDGGPELLNKVGSVALRTFARISVFGQKSIFRIGLCFAPLPPTFGMDDGA